ncbi:polymeric immunoglobulin receptor-like isoform X1, partial [Clarias magur]
MQVCFLLLIIQLHVTEGCKLESSGETKHITAYRGDSVLLPCFCTDLNSTAVTFTWKKYTNNGNVWIEISPESEQYRDKFQLVNDHSSGNLSLLISHLTVEDGGDYRCSVTESKKDVKLSVAGCRLEGRGGEKSITAYTGDSVLLPCSCTDLHTTPVTVTWTKYTNVCVEISPESEQYKDRFRLVNNHSSGNLSLLISHLTVEDGGLYMCSVTGDEFRDVRLTVKEATRRKLTSRPKMRTSTPDVTSTKQVLVVDDKTNPDSETPGKESLPFVPFAVVTVIFLHIIVAVVYWRTRKK